MGRDRTDQKKIHGICIFCTDLDNCNSTPKKCMDAWKIKEEDTDD